MSYFLINKLAQLSQSEKYILHNLTRPMGGGN